MASNKPSQGTNWTGGATNAFKLFNWELFVKPRRWLMVAGVILFVGASGQIFYEFYSDKDNIQRIRRNKRVLELAREVKRGTPPAKQYIEQERKESSE